MRFDWSAPGHILAATLVAYVLFESLRIGIILWRAKAPLPEGRFERVEGRSSMLVVGDSTASGVGAKPEESVPGRLSLILDAAVENNAISGSRSKDVHAQLESAKRSNYDLILIQVGGNDITHFTSLEKTQKNVETFLAVAKKHSERVVLITAGYVGDAPLFPLVLRPTLNYRTKQLRDVFKRTADEKGVLYIDMLEEMEPFLFTDYAADQFHPSGTGYAKWFVLLQKDLHERWPELFL